MLIGGWACLRLWWLARVFLDRHSSDSAVSFDECKAAVVFLLRMRASWHSCRSIGLVYCAFLVSGLGTRYWLETVASLEKS